MGGELEESEKALKNQDFDVLKQLGHSIKGGAWNLTAKDLGDRAFELEETGKNQSLDACWEAFRNLSASFRTFKDYIENDSILEE